MHYFPFITSFHYLNIEQQCCKQVLTNFLGFEHIIRASKSLCNHLEPIVQEQEIDPDVRTKNLNILKMMMYLFTQIMKTKDTKLAADVSTKKNITT